MTALRNASVGGELAAWTERNTSPSVCTVVQINLVQKMKNFYPIAAILALLCVSRLAAMPARSARITLNEWPSYNIIAPDGPGTYAFGYEIDDPNTLNRQYRNEERRPNGDVHGSFGVLNADGTITHTTYVADQHGYRSQVRHQRSDPRQSWSTNASQKSEDLHLRPSSNVLFAYPPLRPPLQTVDNVGERLQSVHQQESAGESSITAAFPFNSKLSAFFMTPEYLENVSGALN